MKINNINFNMIGIIEFREDEHQRNMKLVHNIKKDICELLRNMAEDEIGERRYPVYDEKRGRGMMRRGGRANMKTRDGNEDYEHYDDESMDDRYRY